MLQEPRTLQSFKLLWSPTRPSCCLSHSAIVFECSANRRSTTLANRRFGMWWRLRWAPPLPASCSTFVSFILLLVKCTGKYRVSRRLKWESWPRSFQNCRLWLLERSRKRTIISPKRTIELFTLANLHCRSLTSPRQRMTIVLRTRRAAPCTCGRSRLTTGSLPRLLVSCSACTALNSSACSLHGKRCSDASGDW